MNARTLQAFHSECEKLDFKGPFEALLEEFRRGDMPDSDRYREDAAITTHLVELSCAWDRIFPPFPDCFWPRRTPAWEGRRILRDLYLQRLLVGTVPTHKYDSRLIVNPATVFGRHAMALARELPDYEVIGSDLDLGPHRLYRMFKSLRFPKLENYRFEHEDIFEPDLKRRPVAVTFFGACGSVTDGCMEYAINVNSPFLICRSCCHDNIGGNTKIVIEHNLMGWFFAYKNWVFRWILKNRPGFYFSDRFSKNAYPKSKVARELLDSDTMIDIAGNSVFSDICRSIIDLDRCLYLQEKGYDVMYREELFFAHRRDGDG